MTLPPRCSCGELMWPDHSCAPVFWIADDLTAHETDAEWSAVHAHEAKEAAEKWAETNVDRAAHYHVVPFSWSAVVEPGETEVRLVARAVDLDGGKCRAYFKPHQFSRMHVEVGQ